MKLLITLTLIFIGVHCLQAQDIEVYDELASAMYPSNGPGASILVAKGDDVLFRKGYGKANLELDVDVKPDMVFQIGSITKQFTAVAILMLMEEGKLSLQDDITKFIPDYPTHGYDITIHHLLTHTSGIKSYTSMREWMDEWRTDFTPLELIDFFKNQPMDFAPGEEWSYNNSAYFILGYVIEKASGKPYPEFIQERIFDPLGMDNSYYGSVRELIENRAYGYQVEADNFVNAEFLSLTQPYAAGSLMSTVDDLYTWNSALYEGKLLKKETLDLAFNNYTLNDGEAIDYGYGWGLSAINGSPTREHSGGIFGYVSNGIYLPEEEVYVIILTNCNCKDPGALSTRLAAMAIGKPYPDEDDVISLEASQLEKFAGVYEFEDGVLRAFTLEGDQLYSQRENSQKIKIYPVSRNRFFYEESLSQVEFKKDGSEVTFISRDEKFKGVRTDKELPSNEEIEVSEEILKRYEGTYNLAPGFDIVMTVEDGKLMTQATGQGKFQLFAKSETRFFLKVVPAEVEFIADENGEYNKLILYQNGQEVTGRRLD